jgi:magnesium transporter
MAARDTARACRARGAFMRQRYFEIGDDLRVSPAQAEAGSVEPAGGKLAWIDIEEPDPTELRHLLRSHGVEDWLIDHALDFETRHELYESERAVYFGFPPPMSWRDEPQCSLGIILTAGAVITVRNFAFDGFDRWFHPGNSGRRIAARTVPGLLIWLFIAMLTGDAERFYALRDQAELADRTMQDQGYQFDHRTLEELTASANRLLVIIYDALVIVQALQMRGGHIFDLDAHRPLFRAGADNLQTLREGVEMLLRRLETISQQHSINMQRQTDHRIRLLTIFSVLFMPPTLITGIYGMNLQNIPGLGEPAAYVAVFAVMAGVAVWMLVLFYRRGWFS